MTRIIVGVMATLAAFLPGQGAIAQPASMSVPGSSIPPEMRAAFEEKLRLIEQIMAAVDSAPDAATMTVANTVWLRESLYRMSLEQVRALGAPESFADASAAVVRSLDGVAQLGSSTTELVYYPVTPCRYIDTRVVGGPLSGTRTYDLSFTGGAFGGQIACDPKQAVGGDEKLIGALAINVTIVAPTAMTGFIGVRPAGATSTTSLVNWYAQGPSVQAANAGIVTTNQSPATAAEIEFFGSPTQFIVDVFGVFAAPSATATQCVAGTLASANVTPAGRNYALTTAACPAGYATVSVNCNASAGDLGGGNLRRAEAGVNNPGPSGTCAGYYAGSTSVTVTAQRLCCRMPGR